MCTDRPAIKNKFQPWEIHDKKDLTSWVTQLLSEWDDNETKVFHDDLAQIIVDHVSEALHLLQCVEQGQIIRLLSPEELLYSFQDR